MHFMDKTLRQTIVIALLAFFSIFSSDAVRAGAVPDRIAWPQTRADVPADPSVLFGQLPNGMRYAIMHNEKPANAVSIRLRIGSGSFVEKDDELGIAHFLEHMAFRGSTNYPDGELIKTMERLGLQFGADTNASTGGQDTVYQFDLAKNDLKSLTTGFRIFRDIASRLDIRKDAIDTERGVVLAEERSGDTPSAKAWKAQAAFYLEGQVAGNRDTIGTAPTISALSQEQLRAFYEAHYRPQNTALIVVGAVEPTQIEEMVKAEFSDWTDNGTAPVFDRGQIKDRDLTVKSVQVGGATESIKILWIRPFDHRPPSRELGRKNTVRRLLVHTLNQRLKDLSQAPNSSIVDVSASYIDVLGSAEGLELTIAPVEGRRDEALEATLNVVRSTAEFGVSTDELSRVQRRFALMASENVRRKGTRLNSNIASDILDNVASDWVHMSPELMVDQINEAIGTMRLSQVGSDLQALSDGSAPLVFHVAPLVTEKDRTLLETTVARVLTQQAKRYEAPRVVAWPYERFGKPGGVVYTEQIPELGVTIVDFANGTRLAVKPTKYQDNNVLVKVGFGGGFLAFPAASAQQLWNINQLLSGGTSKLTAAELRRILMGFDVSVDVRSDPQRFWLNGASRTDDLAMQLKLLAAFYTDAVFRSDNFASGIANDKADIVAKQAYPDKVLGDAYYYLSHGQRPHWKAFTDPAELDALKLSTLKAMMRSQTSGPVEVSVVGDVSVDEAIQLVASTFGALRTNTKKLSGIEHPSLPIQPGRSEPYRYYHTGRPDQGSLTLVWGTDWYFGLGKDTFSLTIAAEVLRARVTQAVRNELGIGYSPNLWLDPSVEFEGNGAFGVSLDVPTDKFATFQRIVTDQIHDMAQNGVTDDEFMRAKGPELEGRQKAIETNALWLEWLAGLVSDPQYTRPLITNYIDAYAAVTAADVRDAMKRQIDGKVPLTLEVVPETGR